MKSALASLVSLLLLTPSAQAGWEYSLFGDYRTFESGFSLVVQSAYNHLLWGEKKSPEDWQYGFLRAGGDLAVHGRARAFVELYPVSILRLGVQQSSTSRFYEVKPFDCDEVNCGGVVHRTVAYAQLVGAVGPVFASLYYSNAEINHAEKKQSLAIESDNLLMKPGGGGLSGHIVFLGYKKEHQVYGLASMASKVRQVDSGNRAQYFVYRITIDEIQYSAMLGQYESTFSDRGLSAVVGAEWTVGEPLSLF